MKKITAAFLLKLVCFLLILGNTMGMAKAIFNKASLSTSYAAIPDHGINILLFFPSSP